MFKIITSAPGIVKTVNVCFVENLLHWSFQIVVGKGHSKDHSLIDWLIDFTSLIDDANCERHFRVFAGIRMALFQQCRSQSYDHELQRHRCFVGIRMAFISAVQEPIMSYNATVVKIYNATSCIVSFENKTIFCYFEKNALYSLQNRCRCSCKFRSRKIGSSLLRAM
jgi:hypothetical protein